jgi:hypothetical protein
MQYGGFGLGKRLGLMQLVDLAYIVEEMGECDERGIC